MSEKHCDGDRGCIFWNGDYPCSRDKISPDGNRRLACGFYVPKYLTMKDIFELIAEEIKTTSKEKGGFNSTHEGLGVIFEEFDEFKDEVRANKPQRACDEAVQLAAMAIRFIYDFGKKITERVYVDCTQCEFANSCIGWRDDGCRKYQELPKLRNLDNANV